MRIIETKAYLFTELSEEAKEKAIEKVRESYYNGNDFAEWAIDDCALFEPSHKELEGIEGYDFPLIKNTRKNIYFDCDRRYWYLDCDKAMVITNIDFFLKWLGIDRNLKGLEDIRFDIYTPSGRYSSTTIEFEDFSEDFNHIIDDAIDKFNNHIESVLERIEKDIEYRYSDESIIEDINCNEYEFNEEGGRI